MAAFRKTKTGARAMMFFLLVLIIVLASTSTRVSALGTSSGMPIQDACAAACAAAAVRGVVDEKNTFLCYAGTFYSKMLTELNSGSAKTPEHVHVHLLPYLLGSSGLDELQYANESPDNATCSVCFEDAGAAEGLRKLRESIAPSVVAAYDAMGVCAYEATAALVLLTPQYVLNGAVFLKPQIMSAEDEAAQIIQRAMRLVGKDGCDLVSRDVAERQDESYHAYL